MARRATPNPCNGPIDDHEVSAGFSIEVLGFAAVGHAASSERAAEDAWPALKDRMLPSHQNQRQSYAPKQQLAQEGRDLAKVPRRPGVGRCLLGVSGTAGKSKMR